MSAMAVVLAMMPPPLPPKPWEPGRFPEYEAVCGMVDKDRGFIESMLVVSGQGAKRRMRLEEIGQMGSPAIVLAEGPSSGMVYNPVTDGTYSYVDYVSQQPGTSQMTISAKALGPRPQTLILQAGTVGQSVVFEEPNYIGLCTTTTVSAGSPYMPASSREAN